MSEKGCWIRQQASQIVEALERRQVPQIYFQAPKMAAEIKIFSFDGFVTLKSHIKLLTKSFWPIKSIIKTILCPTDPPIEKPFRNAANIKSGMLEFNVKMIATHICSTVQNMAFTEDQHNDFQIFNCRNIWDPLLGWSHWNVEINIQILDGQ